VKLGFYTACLPDLSIEEVAGFAAEAGFETLEIDVGAHLGDPREAGQKLRAVRAEGVEVCALTSGGGLLDGDQAAAETVRASTGDGGNRCRARRGCSCRVCREEHHHC
jgi:sugar phosphate isomerase/epimerase